ncbi:MAG: trehalose-phosphatase [Candidatus Binatia bacterium]
MNVTRSKAQQGRTKNPAYLNFAHPWVWKSVLDARRVFLFLDLDGTLVEIEPTPSAVELSAESKRSLVELTATPNILVAVVSGRRIEEIQSILHLSGIFYVGLHGLVSLTPQGERICHPVGQEVIDALQSLLEKFNPSVLQIPGIFFEDKGLTLALHFRQAREEKASEVVKEFVQTVGIYQKRGIPLEILQGKEVVEVKPADTHKGKAVAYLLDRYGRGALPIYMGDDVTDEAAFLTLGQKGITILVTEIPRATAATYYLRNPDEVHEFLKRLTQRRAKTT